MSNIRKLNENGLKEFASFLKANYKSGAHQEKIDIVDLEIPTHLLFDDKFSNELKVKKELKTQKFENRFQLGKYYFNYLHQSLSEEEEHGQGLWSWLSLYHFNELYSGKLLRGEFYIPLGKVDAYTIIEPQKHLDIRTTNPLDYRHPVKGYFHFYRTFGDSAEILCSPSGMTFHGDIAEQIGGILWLKQYKIIMDLFKLLYWDNESKTFKKADGKGALTSNSSQKAYLGGLRRARAVIDALMDIHNFEKINKPMQLKDLMGDEFKAQNLGAQN